ncbi:MAG: TauD/TfdA family dioxygenase, partial [Alphaproteobacteria bacterium]
MSVSITPANPARPDFVGVVAGIDLKNPVSAADAAAIDAGMDKFGVLVFHGQDINDEQQLAFSRHFGPLETAT